MRLLRNAAPFVCAATLLAIAPDPAWKAAALDALGHSHSWADPFCRVILDPTNKGTRVVPPSRPADRGRRTASVNLSTISVQYNGFTPEAQAAFQFAVETWQQQVASPQTIAVVADYADLGNPLLLGQAGPATAFANFNASALNNTWYPIALVNRFALSPDFNGADPEITAMFNNQAAWYFGTDGITPPGKVDFVSVVLHELGHGLGFIGAGCVSTASVPCSFTGVPAVGAGTVRDVSGAANYPFIFDAFTADFNNRNLTNTIFYPDNSAPLASALQGGAGGVFWNGPAGSSATPQGRPKLYSPSPWKPGSSYSHLDEDTYPPGNFNSLMTPSIGQQEAIHVIGAITLGMFQDMGWSVTSCSFGLSPATANIGTAGGTATVIVTAPPGCTWTAASNASFVTITGGSSGSGDGTVTYAVQPYSGVSQRVATLTIGGQTFTIRQAGTGPAMAVDKTSLLFSANSTGAALTSQTSGQAVRLTQSGAGTVTWTAQPNQPWLTVSPTSGTGTTTLTIGVQSTGALPASGTLTGAVNLSFTGAGSTAGPINVSFTLYPHGTTSVPFGTIDTPVNNATGVTGAFPFTGWGLDDVEVSNVAICRAGFGAEQAPIDGRCGGAAQIFVGNAIFIDGARPDVQAAFPAFPRSTRAGWGFMVLTNMLPAQGNGTYTFYAYLTDADSHTTPLGTRTITCSNATSVSPFGAIDTPGQGDTISGTAYLNFGWTLTPQPKTIPLDGSTITVVIDGLPVGNVSYNHFRSDIATLFPGLNNTNGGVGLLTLNTTALANGLHTIAWGVIDDAGVATGVGSRYFTVSNGAGLQAGSVLTEDFAASASSLTLTSAAQLMIPARVRAAWTATGRKSPAVALGDEVNAAALDALAIRGARGWNFDAPDRRFRANPSGQVMVQSEELDRLELGLSASGGHQYSGYLRIGNDLAPLPIGSTLNPSTGVFTWQPGVGFVGTYDLVFVRWAGGRALARQEVRVVLNPKSSGRVGPQIVIDIPTRQQDVGQPFVIAGWAADLDAATGTGIDTLHVWAYPSTGAAPTFLGVTAFGGARPDVAAVHGEQFRHSGYGLTVEDLEPGTYDIAVFAWSRAAGKFLPARTVRVTVR